MTNYLILAGCLLLGQILNLNRKADIANEEFIVKKKKFNFKRDFLIRNQFKISLSILSSIVALVLSSEWITEYDKISIIQKTIFITIGYSGSYLILKYLNKNIESLSDTIDANPLSINKNEEHMEETPWELDVESLDDTAEFDSQVLPVAAFAQITEGVLDGLKIVYAIEPLFSKVTFTRLDTTTYIAGPVRRPIGH